MSASRRIPVAGPWITDAEVRAVAEAAATAWYEEANAPIERFEAAFAARVGRRHALALPSCTSAIHLSLLALGVGPGDEVVVPDATWIASAAPISYVGATPVFADVDEATWCLSVDSLAACVTERTKAVVAVDLYGATPEMDRLAAFCEARGLALVEDAAEAIGSSHRGRPAGSFGATSTFSFHGSKTLTTGEGGMVLTDDEALARRMAFLRDHGRPPGDTAFRNAEVAHKYKMSALQAALGLAQLERLDELVERKRQLFAWYRERLGALCGVALNAEPPGTRNSYWMTTAVVDPAYGLTKAELGAAMAEAGVATRPFFSPLSSLPAYAGCPSAVGAPSHNPVSYRLGATGINLPSALCLTEDDVDFVCSTLREVLARGGDGGARRRAPAAEELVADRRARELLASLKATDRLDRLYARSIPLAEDRGFLVPVCELHATDAALAEELARWRAAGAEGFLTRFPVSAAGTAAWLRRVLDADDRILFLVVDRHGAPLGHLGLVLSPGGGIEVDNVLRGTRRDEPGAMALALCALVRWTTERLAPPEVFLRVLVGNDRAVRLYRRSGFREAGAEPLRCHRRGDAVSYEPPAATDAAPPDARLLRMAHRP